MVFEINNAANLLIIVVLSKFTRAEKNISAKKTAYTNFCPFCKVTSLGKDQFYVLSLSIQNHT